MAKGKYQEWITEDGLTLIEGWAKLGLTDRDIAHNIGISEQTLNVWKKQFPLISESLKTGKQVADIRVVNALYQRALGYEYEEVITEIRNVSGKDADKHIKKTKKVVPPDVTAQIFWLKNRMPKHFRDKVVYEPEGQDDVLLKMIEKWDSDDV